MICSLTHLRFVLKPCIITDISPVTDADPQVTKEAGSAVATVGFARPFVSSEFFQLADAVGEQHVRQLLISEARNVVRVLQLQLHLWTGWPIGGSCVSAGLTGPCCWLFCWFVPGEETSRGKSENFFYLLNTVRIQRYHFNLWLIERSLFCAPLNGSQLKIWVCQRMLLFAVSDHFDHCFSALHTTVDFNQRQEHHIGCPALKTLHWQKYLAGNIRGHCKSCGRSVTSNLTSAQSRPPRITNPSLKIFPEFFFPPLLMLSTFLFFSCQYGLHATLSFKAEHQK